MKKNDRYIQSANGWCPKKYSARQEPIVMRFKMQGLALISVFLLALMIWVLISSSTFLAILGIGKAESNDVVDLTVSKHWLVVHVVDEMGYVLPGTQVSVFAGARPYENEISSKIIDRRGNAFFYDMPNVSAIIVASLPGFSNKTVEISLDGPNLIYYSTITLESMHMIYVLGVATREMYAEAFFAMELAILTWFLILPIIRNWMGGYSF